MADEAFHEIHMNGKQLVFLFMAATVVAVVVFLCGVMVGRGVQAQRGELVAAAETVGDPTADLAPISSSPVASSGGTSPASNENLSYPDRLATEEAPPEALEPEAPAPKPAPVVAAAAISAKAAPIAAAATHVARAASNAVTKPAAATAPPPSGGSAFTVQVAAIKERAEADSMAQRLSGKGYPAYVTTSPAGAPRMFRVRIGQYKERREAESVAFKLEKEEQFKPWITR